VQVGDLRQQPFCGLPHGDRAVDPARLGLPEGRDGMLQVALGHQLLGDGEVLVVEQLLDVPPDKLLVGR
jgi:hypothetical protein